VTLLKIAHIGHPVLRRRAEELDAQELARPETQRFIDDLIETMRDANGAGLAATQLFQPVRICAIEVHDNPRYPYKPNVPLTVLVNPVIEPLGDETFENYEGCLSVPNLRGLVKRHVEVRVTALHRDGTPFDRRIAGLTAGTFQHEVDHLDGVLFVDRVHDPKSLCTWDEYRRHHEAAFVARAKALVAEYGS
jgi:peptide deformylase